jgi:hypothetical protein
MAHRASQARTIVRLAALRSPAFALTRYGGQARATAKPGYSGLARRSFRKAGGEAWLLTIEAAAAAEWGAVEIRAWNLSPACHATALL